MNKVILIGNLTRDPELTVYNDKKMARFTVAVPRTYGDETDFIKVNTWGNLAENCERYLIKGSKVAVVGSIQTGSYEKDGVKRQTFDIRADQVEFLSRPQATQQQPQPQQQMIEVEDDGDMPF